MPQFILALDQGTTSSRSILFNHKGKAVAVEQQEFPQIYPQPGWVEHDPEDIWSTQIETAKRVLQKQWLGAQDIAAIGITNQRETTIVWDRATGKPLMNAIVWQDRRTAEYCESLKQKGLEEPIRAKTGLVIDPYFSGTKIRWILENIPGARAKAERGELVFGNIDTFLIWRLTGGKAHVTDYSNASRTMLFNIHTLQWDEDLLHELNIPKSMLPEVRPSSEIYGETHQGIFGSSIRIAGDAGDQQAATFGQTCFDPGTVKNTYGTGCFMLMNTGTEPRQSRNGLLTTIGWGLDGAVTYCLEGSVFIAGAAVQWLRDELQIISQAEETEGLAGSIPTTGGVYLVPAFTGLGAPYWDAHARGILTGLTRGSGRAQITRAALEAAAYQTRDVLEAMRQDSGLELKDLRVDGGMVANNFLMQFQADILNIKVERPQVAETTALGAAYLAGLAVGYWENLEDIQSNWALDRSFEPKMEAAVRDSLYQGWKEAIKKAQS